MVNDNKAIKIIEKEETKLNENINNVKKSKKLLLDFKKILGKTFPKNNKDKNRDIINNTENSTGEFGI